MIGSDSADVVIAGGGVAGASVAAALGEFGYRVLIVEPGLDGSKRLAGELIHPPGVSDLAELGLLAPLQAAGGMPVLGFAVFPDSRTTSARILPYSPVPGASAVGLAVEHEVIRERLLAAVERLPHVTVYRGARVIGVDLDRTDSVRVLISRGTRETAVRAQFAVAADGSASPLRRMAGIGQQRTRISQMFGYVLDGARLPHPGFGNTFVGGPAPALAYQLSDNTTRVMFDIPFSGRAPHEPRARHEDAAHLQALPEPFRSSVKSAMEAAPALVSTCYSIVPDTVLKERLVLVGDAAGCCHPLTATGLSRCTRDAIQIRQALRETQGDVARAIRRYAQLRTGGERTRRMLSESLYAAFTASTPDMQLLRRGILRYWESSPRGRAATMALLSTSDDRMSVMALQYARTVAHALAALTSRNHDSGRSSVWARGHTALQLSHSVVRHVREALRGFAA